MCQHSRIHSNRPSKVDDKQLLIADYYGSFSDVWFGFRNRNRIFQNDISFRYNWSLATPVSVNNQTDDIPEAVHQSIDTYPENQTKEFVSQKAVNTL